MSFEVLRQVKLANELARREEERRRAELSRLTPECPSHPLEAWHARDTTTGTPGSRRTGD